jgi:hypothetical protein
MNPYKCYMKRDFRWATRNLGGAGLGPSKKKEIIRRTLNYFS